MSLKTKDTHTHTHTHACTHAHTETSRVKQLHWAAANYIHYDAIKGKDTQGGFRVSIVRLIGNFYGQNTMKNRCVHIMNLIYRLNKKDK